MLIRRRVLNSPDFQLLVRAKENCDCGSGEDRASCCHQEVHPEQEGVLWPHFHLCECDNEYHEYTNPRVRGSTPLEHAREDLCNPFCMFGGSQQISLTCRTCF